MITFQFEIKLQHLVLEFLVRKVCIKGSNVNFPNVKGKFTLQNIICDFFLEQYMRLT